MKNIIKLLELQRERQKYDGGFAERNDLYFYFGILNELEEAKTELLKENYQKLEEETGDLLWDVLNFIGKLEQRGFINSEKMIENICIKFSERMPFIAEKRVETDPKIRTALWNEAKRKQKERAK